MLISPLSLLYLMQYLQPHRPIWRMNLRRHSVIRPASELKAEHTDFVIFVVHGVGGGELLEGQYVDDFRRSLDAVKLHHWPIKTRNKNTDMIPPNYHVELVEWKSVVLPDQRALLRRLKPPSPVHIEGVRDLADSAAADLLFFSTGSQRERILNRVQQSIESKLQSLRNYEKFEKSKIVLVGYSLGSMILYELLEKLAVSQTHKFHVSALFLFGSPLSAYRSLTGDTNLLLHLPKTLPYYNIIHPFDPIAFRQEPLVDTHSVDELPIVIPHWKIHPYETLASPKPERCKYDFTLQAHDPIKELGPLFTAIAMCNSHKCYFQNRDVASFVLTQLMRLM